MAWHIIIMDDNSYQIDFIQKNLTVPCVLVGTGGAGKTTLGTILARTLGLEFMDSDAVLESEEGQTIPQIFATHGEAYFRDKERETIRTILTQPKPNIIGTGGGAFINDDTRALVLDKAISIFMKADLDTLLKRVGTGAGRPLFDNKDPSDVLRDMIKTRYPIYAQATLEVETADEPAEETVNKIISALYNHLASE